MGPKLHQEFNSSAINRFLDSYPPTPRRIRMLDFMVRNFPRRLFKAIWPGQQEKFISHLLFFTKPLSPEDTFVNTTPFELGIADSRIINYLASHREAFPAEMYYNRLARGDACYYVAHEGEVRSYQWVNFRECALVWGQANSLTLTRLNEDEAYLYDFYTYSDARNQGFGKLLKLYVWSDLFGKNFASICNGIHHDNFVSLKLHLGSEFKLKNLYYAYQLMSWQGVFKGTRSETLAVKNWLASLDLNFLM